MSKKMIKNLSDIEKNLEILERIFSFQSYRNKLTEEQKEELSTGLQEILQLLNGKDGKN